VTSSKNYLQNLVSRNNILQVRNDPGYYSIFIARPSPTNSFDYDLYNGRIEGAPGAEAHGIRLEVSEPVEYDPGNGEREYWVAESSKAHDAGVPIPNFNDGYEGSGPDIGAFERGLPPLRYSVDAGRAAPTWIRESGGTGRLPARPDSPRLPPKNAAITTPGTRPKNVAKK